MGLGDTAPSGQLEIASSTQLSARVILSGQEYYQAANTSTDGIALLVGVNRTNNRQLWFADSANLTQTTTNGVLRLTGLGTTVPGLSSIASDGVTALHLAIQSGGGNVGIGNSSPGTKLDVTGSVRASSQLISTVATGTAPLAVSSTTAVSNLNADMVDGSHRDTAYNSFGNGTVPVRHSSGYLFSNYFNMTANDVSSGVTMIPVETGSDGYLRWGNAAAVIGFLNGGTGLDADTVDGISSGSFLRNDVDNSVSGTGVEVTFPSTTNINSSTGDLASLEVYQGTVGGDAFMQFHIGGDYAGYFGLDGGINDFVVGGWSFGATSYRVWHAGNDGSGSGLDADVLDGLNSAQFLRSDATDTTTGNLTAATFYTSNWFRATGDSGLYFETYGTGIRSPISELGEYGSVATYGGEGGWEGFSINGDFVFMSNLTDVGIYNDISNRWIMYHDTGTATYFNEPDSATEAMRINANGNVGIGTTGASNKLVVGSDLAGASAVPGNTISVGSSGTTTDAVLQVGEGSAAKGFIKWDGGSNWTEVGSATSAQHLILQSAGGNVGIGTTTVDHKLRVVGAVDLYGIVATTTTTNDGTPALNAAIYGANSSFGGYGMHGVSTLGYGVYGESAGAGTALRGRNSSTGYALYCDATTANKCGGNQAWFNASDRKLKRDIVSIDNALNKVLNLQGVTYVMKNDPSNTRVMGFIAQDTLPYAPEVVSYDSENGYYGMQTGQLTALIVEAMKEQQLQIDQLSGGTLSITFTAEGDLTINGSNGTYTVTETSQGTLTTILGASKAVIGKVTAGLVTTKELVVEQSATIANLSVSSLQVSGQNISQYIRNIVQQELQTTSLPQDSFADDFTTDNLLVTENATIAGELAVAAVNTTDLTADTSVLGSLLAETATIAGDLTVEADASVAGTLIAGNVEAGSSRFDTLEARMAELENIKAQTAELVDATVSGTLYADSIYNFDEKVADAFKKPTLLDLLTNQDQPTVEAASPASIYEPVENAGYQSVNPDIIATDSAILSLNETDIVLGASALFVEKYLEVNGHAYVAQSLGIGQTLKVGNSLTITNGTIEYAPANEDQPVLAFQPSGKGKLDLLAGALTIEQGKVTITGNLNVAGSLKADTLLTNLVQPAEFGNPFQVQVAGVATESGEVKKSRFEIINETGEAVATFDADGNASFKGVLSVANQNLTTEDTSDDTVTTDKSSGQAKLTSGKAELKIQTPKATASSLIYVTPKGSTDNKVMYIKTQADGEFTVGFDEALDQDVEFNWWIVN